MQQLDEEIDHDDFADILAEFGKEIKVTIQIT